MRAWRRMCFALSALVVLVGCSSDGDGPKPFVPAHILDRVWTGRELIGLTDRAAASLAVGKPGWRPLPDPPFDHLDDVTGVWAGSKLIVLGITCDHASTDSATTLCTPGAVVAYSYSPRDGWRKIRPSSEKPFGPETRDSQIHLGGWDGHNVIAALSGAPFALDPAAQTWELLPPYPQQLHGQVLCVTSNGVGVADAHVRANLDNGPSPATALADGAWTPVALAPLPRPIYGDAACAQENPVVISSTITSGGNQLDVGQSARFDTTTRSWTTLPPPPEPLVKAAVIASDGDRLLFRTTAGALMALDTARGRWQTFTTTLPQPVAIEAWTGDTLVYWNPDRSPPALRSITVA